MSRNWRWVPSKGWRAPWREICTCSFTASPRPPARFAMAPVRENITRLPWDLPSRPPMGWTCGENRGRGEKSNLSSPMPLPPFDPSLGLRESRGAQRADRGLVGAHGPYWKGPNGEATRSAGSTAGGGDSVSGFKRPRQSELRVYEGSYLLSRCSCLKSRSLQSGEDIAFGHIMVRRRKSRALICGRHGPLHFPSVRCSSQSVFCGMQIGSRLWLSPPPPSPPPPPRRPSVRPSLRPRPSVAESLKAGNAASLPPCQNWLRREIRLPAEGVLLSHIAA